MSELTQAQRDRAQDLRNYPSRDALSKVEAAWKLLDRYAWPRFKACHPRLKSTAIAVVGRLPPLAKTIAYPDGSCLIQINDGIVNHLETMARILAAGAHYFDDGKVVEKPALTSVEVTDKLRLAYDQWKARERLQRVEAIVIPLGPVAEIVATNIFWAAIVFTILHEFGHAACGHHLGGDPLAQEPEADRWAVNALFSSAVAASQQQDYLLGGALLSIRALASREIVQKSELHGYPPSEKRFRTLIDIARHLFPNELLFYMKTTSAFSSDMRLQTGEHDLGAGVSAAPSQPEQFVSLIVSQLQAVARHQTTLSGAIEEITTSLKRTSGPVLLSTAEICQRVFNAEAESAGQLQEEQDQIANLFRQIVPHLPQSV